MRFGVRVGVSGIENKPCVYSACSKGPTKVTATKGFEPNTHYTVT